MTAVIEVEVQRTPVAEGHASAWEDNGKQKGMGSRENMRALPAGDRVTEAALEAVPIPNHEAGSGADKAKNGPVEEVEAAEIAVVAWAFVAVGAAVE
jgi:hypothetical protein